MIGCVTSSLQRCFSFSSPKNENKHRFFSASNEPIKGTCSYSLPSPKKSRQSYTLKSALNLINETPGTFSIGSVFNSPNFHPVVLYMKKGTYKSSSHTSRYTSKLHSSTKSSESRFLNSNSTSDRFLPTTEPSVYTISSAKCALHSFAAFTPASGHMRKISRAFSNCSLEKFSLHEGETSSGKEEVSARALYDTELVFVA